MLGWSWVWPMSRQKVSYTVSRYIFRYRDIQCFASLAIFDIDMSLEAANVSVCLYTSVPAKKSGNGGIKVQL